MIELGIFRGFIGYLWVGYIGEGVKNREIRIPVWIQEYFPMLLIVLTFKVSEMQEDPGDSSWFRSQVAS